MNNNFEQRENSVSLKTISTSESFKSLWGDHNNFMVILKYWIIMFNDSLFRYLNLLEYLKNDTGSFAPRILLRRWLPPGNIPLGISPEESCLSDDLSSLELPLGQLAPRKTAPKKIVPRVNYNWDIFFWQIKNFTTLVDSYPLVFLLCGLS